LLNLTLRTAIGPEKLHTPTAESPPKAGNFAEASVHNRCFLELIHKKQLLCQKKAAQAGGG